MKRLCAFATVLTILCAGGVGAVTLDEGSSFRVSVMTLSHNVITCRLETPHDGTIVFAPGDQSRTTDKYRVDHDNAGTFDCAVTILKIDTNDEGTWTMTYEHDGDSDARISTYNITVNPAIQELSDIEDENITLLSEIFHYTRQEKFIDISLDKESLEEECYIQPPNSVMVKANTFVMENVKVQSSSNFVSCRITIGPISEDLLGDWRLCGESTVTKQMRCQPAHIGWNNNNALAQWDSITQPRFNHSVNFGGRVNPGVAGHGNIITCHVITPNGEDLVLTSDVKYPHIERIAFDRLSLCSVVFTDIDSSMLGDWTVYAKFRSAASGLNEVHLPLNFFLYNEKNPYEQAYNITVLPEARHIVNLGTTINVEVSSTGQVDDCQFRTPSGKMFDLNSGITTEGATFKSLDTAICRLAIGPISENLLGEWQIIGKFSNGNQFTERRQNFNIIQDDPTNPIIDEDRTVENLTELVVDTKLGADHRVVISTATFVQPESCHLLTPSGLQYSLIDGFHIPNVEIVEQSGVECGVAVNVQQDTIGQWTLIARATKFSQPIERRLPFTIHVEESFSLGNPVNITEGTDLYIRLPEATYLSATCKLYGPDGEEFTHFENDLVYQEYCGFIVRNVSRAQHGIWQIVFGNDIIYRGTLEVNILASVEISLADLTWTLGKSVDMTYGPEDAVYCKIEDSHGYTISEGFGPCKIVVDRVTLDHKGQWKMYVTVPGIVVAAMHPFYVHILEHDPKPVVSTSVATNQPSVMLTCSVPAGYEVRGCKFRDPCGNILVASHAVGQDGYTFEGSVVNYESNATAYNCTLRLTNPTVNDLGLWRCAVDTEQNTYYGFLTVLYPWLTAQDMVGVNVVTDPVLKEDKSIFHSMEGEPATMTCSIDAAIRYCYFRSRNGTVFNVGPAISSHDYEYVGAGFDAGECGIRFRSLMATDGGAWSCHVGLINVTAEEQRTYFSVEVQEKFSVIHFWESSTVVVRGSSKQPLDYCRFVRIDGMGFTTDNIPEGYAVDNTLTLGLCTLRINNPSILDLHPWTVAAKITGVEGEVYKSTIELLENILEVPQDVPGQGISDGIAVSSAICLWIFVTFLGILLISAGVALIPKNNREWTYSRAAQVRNSFRKQPKHIDFASHQPRKMEYL